jgi:hypothetical protein
MILNDSMLQITQIQSALQIWWANKFSNIHILSWEEIPGGWLSRAFRFEYSTFQKNGVLFVRTVKSREGGYTYSQDRFTTFATSHEMYCRAQGAVTSYGVFAINQEGNVVEDIHDENSEFFHVQDFIPWKSLLSEIQSFAHQEMLPAQGIQRMKQVWQLLASLHNTSLEEGIHLWNAVKRSQREVLTHPQTTLDVLSSYPTNHPILWVETGRYAYLQHMHKIIDREIEFAENTPV